MLTLHKIKKVKKKTANEKHMTQEKKIVIEERRTAESREAQVENKRNSQT